MTAETFLVVNALGLAVIGFVLILYLMRRSDILERSLLHILEALLRLLTNRE